MNIVRYETMFSSFFLFFFFFFLSQTRCRSDTIRSRMPEPCFLSSSRGSLFVYRSNLVPLFSAYRKMYMGDQVLGYTCTMCSKFYKMLSNYLKHKCEPPQFKCPLCPFAAFKAFILHAHQAEQHFKVTSPNTWTFESDSSVPLIRVTRQPIALNSRRSFLVPASSYSGNGVWIDDEN